MIVRARFTSYSGQNCTDITNNSKNTKQKKQSKHPKDEASKKFGDAWVGRLWDCPGFGILGKVEVVDGFGGRELAPFCKNGFGVLGIVPV